MTFRPFAKKLWSFFASLKLTLVCLVLLMLLVVACTLAQVNLGTLGAVNAYIRSPLVWWDVPDSRWSIPVFPGGALVGLTLGLNLLAAQIRRLNLTGRRPPVDRPRRADPPLRRRAS